MRSIIDRNVVMRRILVLYNTYYVFDIQKTVHRDIFL